MVAVNFGTIDIGTNTVLLLIAAPPLQVIHDEARITRLGEGLHQKPIFLPEAQKRTLTALREYRTLCDTTGVKKIAAVGTAAFRKAKNVAEFTDQVQKELGISIEIISGEEEARLSFLSVQHDFGASHQNLVALDIGGGSTEIISEKGGMSLELGTVTLTERYLKQDPAQEEEVGMMIKEIEERLGSLTPPLPPSYGKRGEKGGCYTLVGLAGTVTTLSALKQKLTVWDGNKVQGSVLTREDLERLLKIFRQTTVAEKSKLQGMIKGREDTMLAGTLILIKVMEKLGTKSVIVSDRGLRFGLFHDRFAGGIG